MTKYVASLSSLSRDDVARAGGKGANLGEMFRADLPVPDGCVVTTDAYLAALSNDQSGKTQSARAAPGGELLVAIAAAEKRLLMEHASASRQ